MIEGSLVNLRPVDVSDLERYFAWINDPEVAEHLQVWPLQVSRIQEEAWLAAVMNHTQPPEITYAIETRDEGRHIGSVSLHKIEIVERHAELGIMIGDKTQWNRGYGTDAIMTMLQLAFEGINLNRVYLRTDEDNNRAVACYRKCGFVEEGRLRHDRYRAGVYRDTVMMGVLRSEFGEQPA